MIENWFRSFFANFFTAEQIEEILKEKVTKFKKCFEKFERESSIESAIYNLKDTLGLPEAELNAVADININNFVKSNQVNKGAKLSICEIDNIPVEYFQQLADAERKNSAHPESDSDSDSEAGDECNAPKKIEMAPLTLLQPKIEEQPRAAGKGLKYAKMGKTPTLSSKERQSKLMQLKCHSVPKKSIMPTELTNEGPGRRTIRATMSIDYLREQLIGKFFNKIDVENDNIYNKTLDRIIAVGKKEGVVLESAQEETLYSLVEREHKEMIEIINKFKTYNDYSAVKEPLLELVK